MKFSIATLAGLASAISAASLPSAFTLVADGGLTVQTDGGMSSSFLISQREITNPHPENAWIGANTTTHEVLIRKHRTPHQSSLAIHHP